MPNKMFPVFGDAVEVMISTESTGGALSAIIQHTNPGGGPPPHVHEHEDEVLMALDGEFEILIQDRWSPAVCGQPQFLRRGELHTFRNCGNTTGRILAMATPGGLDRYLESISPIRMPEDAARLFQISDQFGITFPQMPQSEASEQVALAGA